MGRQHVERSEDFGGEAGPAVNEWLHDAAPALAVGSEGRFGVLQIALKRYGGRGRARHGERGGRENTAQTVCVHGRGRKKRGAAGAGGEGGAGNGEGNSERELAHAG